MHHQIFSCLSRYTRNLDKSPAQASSQLFARCVVRAFPFESCFARVFGDFPLFFSRTEALRAPPPQLARRVHLVLGLQGHQQHLALRRVPPLSGCRGLSSHWFFTALPWTIVLLRSFLLRTHGGENRGHSDRHVSDDSSPDRMGLDAVRAGGRRAVAPTPYPRRGRRIRLDDDGEPPSDDSHVGW